MGIVSNFDSRLRSILQHLGIAPYFKSVTIATEEGIAKPNPELFRLAMCRHGLDAGDALYVGDSMKRDVEASRAAGMVPVLILREREITGWKIGPLRKKVEPPSDPNLIYFRSLPDLLTWLQGV